MLKRKMDSLVMNQTNKVKFEQSVLQAQEMVARVFHLPLEVRYEIVSQVAMLDRGYRYGVRLGCHSMERLEEWDDSNGYDWCSHHPVVIANKLLEREEQAQQVS